jgi:hypothetical protein
VAEIQGLYGPFSFPEKLLQQIWSRGEFDRSRAVTADGRTVQILHPGRWNLLGGPDFKGARLRLDGATVAGDVEVHLRAADWAAHRHAGDRAYDDVVLHVVLFPSEERSTPGAKGRSIPILALLPLLHHDLEAYAADEAVERLANHPLARVQEELARLTEPELRGALRRSADSRWAQKVRYARQRIDRLGWEGACHHGALEILGYRFNRAPMLDTAAAWPLARWRSIADDSLADQAFAEAQGRWSLQGLRPANHPRARLRQYAHWVRLRPEWPEHLASLLSDPGSFSDVLEAEDTTSVVRRRFDFGGLRERWAADIGGGAVGGTRLDNLICDGFLPLVTALHPARSSRAAFLWLHWFLGDAPERWVSLLRALGVIGSRAWPASQGAAQGLLGWLVANEQRQSAGG